MPTFSRQRPYSQIIKYGPQRVKTDFIGTAPMNLQEQMTCEKKLYDAFLLSLQDPKLTFWLPAFTKVSYGSRNRRKGYYTDGAPFAK